MADSRKIVLSCIQPTAEMHLGNYFGAVQNWVKLQHEHNCVFGVVDLHAITMPYDPQALRRNTDSMVLDLLACGLDPEKCLLFVQSQVPEHTELCWIFSCNCPFGELRRMTQFKDKADQVESSGGEAAFVSAGLLMYPILQAADILAYRAHFVPVGKDQEQHLELTRVIARRFNQTFGVDLFPEPQPLFTETPKILSLADPLKKMSKSLGPKHYLGVFEDEKVLRKKVKSAVTDTGEEAEGSGMSPGVANLFELLRACGRTDDYQTLLEEYNGGVRQYGRLKGVVAHAVVELTSGIQERRRALEGDPRVAGQIAEMTAEARRRARATLDEVRNLAGLAR